MMLDGKIVLCSHSDEVFSRLGEAPTGQGSRHYNGGISQLSIFDTYLSPAHVWALYHQVCRQQQRVQWQLGFGLHCTVCVRT